MYCKKFYFLDKNAPPKANAGGDQVVTAPISALIINGSQSSDDLRIGQWLWIRDQSSLAIGTIVQDTDKSSVLMVKAKMRIPFHIYIFRYFTVTYLDYFYCLIFYETHISYNILANTYHTHIHKYLYVHLCCLFFTANRYSSWSLSFSIESNG